MIAPLVVGVFLGVIVWLCMHWYGRTVVKVTREPSNARLFVHRRNGERVILYNVGKHGCWWVNEYGLYDPDLMYHVEVVENWQENMKAVRRIRGS